ncbi:hypothetical protein ACFVGY_37635 [Streptomyces sp. NPDC127106]|uniref:hypothetical protein n=1 Tax=Streptomyces sp. NPDC127106 TaxID=3345360 RepID=UPI00363CE6D3
MFPAVRNRRRDPVRIDRGTLWIGKPSDRHFHAYKDFSGGKVNAHGIFIASVVITGLEPGYEISLSGSPSALM